VTEEFAGPASDRVRLRRGAERGRYAPADVLAVLDAGIIAHVGVQTAEGPVVVPMAYGRDDQHLYLHGAVANAALRAADGNEVCVTVTIVDGLIFARTPFHNSMRYRSVVVRGVGRRLHDESSHRRALRLVTDHVAPNWDGGRPPSAKEVRATMAVAVPLTESSAKIRGGGPADEPEDLDGPHWGGTVPITTVFGAPEASPDLRGGIDVPAAIGALEGAAVHHDRRGS